MRSNLFILLALMALLFGACEKDSEIVRTSDTSTVAGELAPITITVFGQLTDNTGSPVADARVSAGNKNTLTDEQGLWRIENARVGATFGYVSFESANHMHGSRTVYAIEGSEYQIDVELLSNTQASSIDALAGGTVQVANSDATVVFGASAFAKTDGTPIANGQITVVAHYLDAADEATYRQMPGDLRALAADASSNTDFTLLTTFGMLAVELTDASGNEVVLASGQTATLTMPQTAAALAAAPATIPLWYFDETDGIWREEGVATLQGNAYVGEVSHFTFWNCDIPTEAVNLCATFNFDVANNPDSLVATGLTVAIVSSNWGTAYGYTDASGRLCGLVPANEPLVLQLYGYNRCGSVIYSQNVGPLSADTDLGTITITPVSNSVLTVTGSASCSGTPSTNGAVRISQGGVQIGTTSLQPDGTFSLSTITCTLDDVEVEVIDYDALSQSDLQTFAYAPSIATGDIDACATALTNFFEMTIDGETFVGDSISMGADGTYYWISGSGFSPSSSYGFDIGVDNTLPVPLTTGTFTADFSGQSSFRVYANNVAPRGAQVNATDVPLTITTVATSASPYTVGSVGPTQATYTDPNTGVVTTYDVSINFSAYTYF